MPRTPRWILAAARGGGQLACAAERPAGDGSEGKCGGGYSQRHMVVIEDIAKLLASRSGISRRSRRMPGIAAVSRGRSSSCQRARREPEREANPYATPFTPLAGARPVTYSRSASRKQGSHRSTRLAAAARATKTLRPAQLPQIRPAILVAGKAQIELTPVPGIIFHRPASCGLCLGESGGYPSGRLLSGR